MNSNNLTAKYYNIVYNYLKPTEVTDKEISLINSIVAPKSKILDVGAGTGRHSLILAQLEHQVTAIDSSKSMLLEANAKSKNIKLINQDIFKFKTTENFNLITLFWNTFNEAALTKKDGIKLLKKLSSFLAKNGFILINIDDPKIVDPSNFNSSIEFSKLDYDYKQSWKTEKYLKKTNTSVSKEEIKIYKNHKLIDSKTTFIKQRYWSVEEIIQLAKLAGLKIELKKLNINNELYILLSKNK